MTWYRFLYRSCHDYLNIIRQTGLNFDLINENDIDNIFISDLKLKRLLDGIVYPLF